MWRYWDEYLRTARCCTRGIVLGSEFFEDAVLRLPDHVSSISKSSKEGDRGFHTVSEDAEGSHAPESAILCKGQAADTAGNAGVVRAIIGLRWYQELWF
jgi:hypothetical protein